MFAFDLTPNQNAADVSRINPTSQGNLSLEVQFKTAPTVVKDAIVYLEYDNTLSIDRFRNVKLE